MAAVISRDTQIHILRDLLQLPHGPPCIFAYGAPATGKTKVLQHVLSGRAGRTAYIDCAETYTMRLLLERILNLLAGVTPGPYAGMADNGYAPFTRCDSLADFCRHVATLLHGDESRTVIVLDRAEKLLRLSGNVLQVFARLAELTLASVTVVLSSSLVWEKLRSGSGGIEPLLVAFPAYTKDEALAILSAGCPDPARQTLYTGLVQIVWNVFNGPCRDICEFQHLVSLMFPKYVEPVDSGDVKSHETPELYRRILPFLKKQLSMIYLRTMSTHEWSDARALEGRVRPVDDLALPYLAKAILIAAYLASYNPTSSDAQLFAKHTRKRAGRARPLKRTSRAPSARKAGKPSQQILGPKIFPLDRLLAIFYSIVDDDVAVSGEIYGQIASLVALRLLQRTSTDDNLDVPRFKCMLGLSAARKLARSIDFNLDVNLFEAV